MTKISHNKIRVLSLFSGCGGMDVGLLLYGQVGPEVSAPLRSLAPSARTRYHADEVIYRSRPEMMQSSPYVEIVAGVECDEWAAKSYEHNIGPHIVKLPRTDNRGRTQLAPASIRDLDPQEYTGKVDVIIGGPPCQAYSLAGDRKGVEDERGDLVYVFADWVAAVRPKLFIMENVEGLLSAFATETVRDLFGEHMVQVKVIEQLIRRYRELGYHVEYKVLDAADYGVPQYRRRVILVGTLPGIRFRFPAATHAPASSREVQAGLRLPHVPCGYYLDDLPPLTPSPATSAWLADGHPPSNGVRPAMTIAARNPSRGGANWATATDNQAKWLLGKHPASTAAEPAFTITAAHPRIGTSNWLAKANPAKEKHWDKGQHPPSVAETPAQTIAADGPLHGPSDWLAVTAGTLAWLGGGNFPPSSPTRPARTIAATLARSGTANMLVAAERSTDGWRSAEDIGTFQRGTAHIGSAPNRPARPVRAGRGVVGGPNHLVSGDAGYAVGNRYSTSGGTFTTAQPAPTMVAEPTNMTLYAVGNRFNGQGNSNSLAEPAPTMVAHPTNITLYQIANRFAGYGGERGMRGFDQPAPTACTQDDLTIFIVQQQRNLLSGDGDGSNILQPSATVGAENPLRLAVRNRLAERGNGSSLFDPSPTIPACSNTVLEAEGTKARARRQAVRPLTVAECARLQTIPTWYSFFAPLKKGAPTRTAGYRAVGNAVPVLLALILAGAIVQAFAEVR